MLKLDNQDLISEFYELIKDAYPDVSFEQVKDICFGPWRFLKDEMESGELDTVRFKYFGIFTVFPGRIDAMLKSNKKNLEKGNMTKEQYLKYEKMLLKKKEKL